MACRLKVQGRPWSQSATTRLAEAPANAGETAHVATLDGWRGIAILLLLIGHFLPVPGIKLRTLGCRIRTAMPICCSN